MKTASSSSSPCTTLSMSTPARHNDRASVEEQTTISLGDPCFSASPTNPMAVVLRRVVSHCHFGKRSFRGRPVATASATSLPSITLDGRLNEPAWRDAAVMKLVQQAPKPGQPTPYETEVRPIETST